MSDDIAAHRFIFIGGLHRSGTSLLHRMIRNHPEVSGFTETGAPEDEGQWLQDVYPTARVYGGPGLFAFSPEAHLTETSPLATPHHGEKLFSQWAKHWDVNQQVLVEKSPPNLIRARFLQQLFPSSRFVFLLRHPIAVSLATAKWLESPLARLLEHWNCAHHAFLEDLPSISHAHVLRYEDLLTEPEATMHKLWDFLQLSPAPLQEALTPAINDHYFAQWENIIPTRPKLRERLSELEQLPAYFGYSLHSPYVLTQPNHH